QAGRQAASHAHGRVQTDRREKARCEDDDRGEAGVRKVRLPRGMGASEQRRSACALCMLAVGLLALSWVSRDVRVARAAEVVAEIKVTVVDENSRTLATRAFSSAEIAEKAETHAVVIPGADGACQPNLPGIPTSELLQLSGVTPDVAHVGSMRFAN